ncbi:CBS domain-containing protein [Priestia megaterium]|uniref:CBS domain-containing protein n=1 Tax=Priestia megaterium TaxID=1404 RepID=UPI002DBBD25A|nr:CBS domain-containing protein [Priestia megaterium]MEC1070029.1 CBS domain-containing protein [Priestia megaterium]
MNIAFFLLPKKEVVTLSTRSTIRQALEKMEYHRYSSVPLINQKGEYAGTLAEGDLLWKLKSLEHIELHELEYLRIEEVPRHRDYEAITINDEMESILSRASEQNFVPVVDDQNIFIGLVRRREIIEYCISQLFIRGEAPLNVKI